MKRFYILFILNSLSKILIKQSQKKSWRFHFLNRHLINLKFKKQKILNNKSNEIMLNKFTAKILSK